MKKGDEIIGNETRVKVVKNKVAPPFKQANFDIMYNEGISRQSELIELGVQNNIIEKLVLGIAMIAKGWVKAKRTSAFI